MEQVNRNEEQTFVPTLEDEFRKYHDRRTGMITPKGSLTVYAEDFGEALLFMLKILASQRKS